MGRKNKYSKELKLSIVKRYLNGEGSTNSLAGEINTTNNIVSNWVKKYKVFGESAFDTFPTNASYTKNFKEKVVLDYLNGGGPIMKCEMYHYGKHYNTKEELIKAIDDWIYYYMYERYQRRFGVKTPYEVRSEALFLQTLNQYPIPENKRIKNYKQEHYTSSVTLAV